MNKKFNGRKGLLQEWTQVEKNLKLVPMQAIPVPTILKTPNFPSSRPVSLPFLESLSETIYSLYNKPQCRHPNMQL